MALVLLGFVNDLLLIFQSKKVGARCKACNVPFEFMVRFDTMLVSRSSFLFYTLAWMIIKVNLYAIVPIHFFIIVMRSITHTYYTLGIGPPKRHIELLIACCFVIIFAHFRDLQVSEFFFSILFNKLVRDRAMPSNTNFSSIFV